MCIFLFFLVYYFSYCGLTSQLSLSMQINSLENFESTLIKFRSLLGQYGHSFELGLSPQLGFYLKVRKNKCTESSWKHFP